MAKHDEFNLALEVGRDGHCMAWVVELPGLFINRSSADAAVEGAPGEIRRYLKWLASHGEKIALPK
ncbi:MAG: hypothetical protein IH851_00125 [Armatimonadetes bacterium]|nr:hypothetical protein [Armatimonadota bacterium]